MKTFDKEIDEYLISIGVNPEDENMVRYRDMINGFVSNSTTLPSLTFDLVVNIIIYVIRDGTLSYDPKDIRGFENALIEYLEDWKAIVNFK